jgi:hypothetical protein
MTRFLECACLRASMRARFCGEMMLLYKGCSKSPHSKSPTSSTATCSFLLQILLEETSHLAVIAFELFTAHQMNSGCLGE